MRYFSTPEDEQNVNTGDAESKDHKTIVYDIKEIKKKPWGRRQADKHMKNNKLKKIFKQKSNPNPKFRGKVKPPPELIKKYSKGEGVQSKGVKTSIHQKKLEKKEKKLKFASEQAARTEVLLTEDSG